MLISHNSLPHFRYSTLDRHVYETVREGSGGGRGAGGGGGRGAGGESAITKQPKRSEYYSSIPDYTPDQYTEYHPGNHHEHHPEYRMTSLQKPLATLHDTLYYHGTTDILEQSLLRYYDTKERGVGYHGNLDSSRQQLTSI